jgi:hypothetical protein
VKKSRKSFPYAALLVKAAAMGLVFVGTSGSEPAKASSFSEWMCKRYCTKLDPVLDRVDEFVRDKLARWKGEISYALPPSIPGKDWSCGLLPGQGGAKCCDGGLRLVIEYSGTQNPYLSAEARYRAICVK